MERRLMQKTLKLEGMSCTSCEMRIENALKKLQGVADAKASFSNSNVIVTYDADVISLDKIIEAIEKLHYLVKRRNEGEAASRPNAPEPSEDKMTVNQFLGIAIILFAVYFVIKNTVGFNFVPKVDQSMGYGILLAVGLLTSLHCIAMCGGINLSQCVSYNFEDSQPSKFSRLKPSLLYNSGRVVSYTVIGGIVGALGSVISFSGAAKGIVAIISGVFMVIMGLNMLNVFPWLRKLNPRMPKIFGNKIHKGAGKYGPFYIGLLNGLMPCGPLQAMQIYALGTGSFVAGAASMFLFSLGTVPLMFGFGAISSLLSRRFTRKMMKVSAMLVIVLGVVMVNRGLSLSGVSIAFASSGSGNIAKIEGDVQVVTSQIGSYSYSPIVVQKGIPVRWTIRVEEGDLNGCNNPLTIPKYNIQKELVPGDNVIEFTPTEEGNIVYTCWMGMIRSNIKVVSDISKVSKKDLQDSDGSSSGAVGGGCCAAGSKATKFAGGRIPTDELAIGKIRDDVQYVSIDVDDYGFSPAVIVVQKGIKTIWTINGKQLNTCNNVLVFPAYDAQIALREGKNEVQFVPEGDFTFSCWMGMLNGYVKVVDDINNIDIDAIKEEVERYRPARGAGGCCGI
ncbi:sulfite exporter TauE/SafE/copper chaperone CopZ [Caldicoprobacter guelmensis]|uniref:urease accessory protein UreH domain-containing protein n=1 Tax=Caldicoprobacter guelmensis TaxID=1170224 RepID=UPI001FAF4F92|nr:sulfite exporter TauE/SafE family protein [Caldicoprobacter guelmensis]MBM7583121.1 sulfite exporter TauE/SafE/copper chaperone CopZ [Caldicoprobacter guelmensis]